MISGFPASIRALLAQLGAVAIVAGLLVLVPDNLASSPPTLWELAGLQGLLSAGLGILFGLAWWWVPINLLFLPGILSGQRFALPALAYLAIFLLLLGFNWGVIRSRVPLYLSHRRVWKHVEEILPGKERYTLLDIGSGLGGMALHLAKARPMGSHEGIEISPASWLISRIRAQMHRHRATFRYGDYRQLDLSQYDVVFAFLSPLVMRELLDKICQEMRPGSLFLSLAFPLPGITPDFVVHTGTGERQRLYGWRVRAGCQSNRQEQRPTVPANQAP